MKPKDCKSLEDVRKLNEQGIAFDGNSITTFGNYLEIKLGCCSFRVSSVQFSRFVDWYSTDQKEVKNLKPRILKSYKEEKNREELGCPWCNWDMKEYVTKFKCRNQNCAFEYKKFFSVERDTK